MPRADTAKKWIESLKSNSDFRFTAKLFQSFTHSRKPAPLDEKDFKDGIAPLIEAGRLRALLMQFPWSFKHDHESRTYVVELARRFREYPLVLEVRHSSWMEESVLDLLADLAIDICNIDQPLFKRSIRAQCASYFRGGLRSPAWPELQAVVFAQGNVRERYDHLYSVEELE